MSSVSSASDLRKQEVAQPMRTEDPEEKFMFDWDNNQPKSWLCGCFSFLVQLILLAATGSFLFGFNLSLLNTSISYIGWEYKWCDFKLGKEEVTGCTAYKNYAAFISTAVFIGAATGSMGGGVFMMFGRRGMCLISMVVFLFGIIASVCANSFPALLWARLLCGLGVGLISVCCPTYMSEVTPANVRGKFGVFHQLFVTVGILAGTLLGLPLALKTPIPSLDDAIAVNLPDGTKVKMLDEIDTFSRIWWRIMLGIGILPVILTTYLMGFVYKFETPYYYMEKQSPKDTERLLQMIMEKDDVASELLYIKESVETSQAAKAAGMTLSQAWKARKDYRWVIFFGCLLSAFQQLGGINVFISSSNKLFEDAGLSGKWPTIVSNITMFVNCIMTIPAVPLIEKLGRRTLLLIGTCGMTVSVGPAAICYWALEDGSKVTQWLAIVGCVCFIICFAATYGPILWVYLFEIYPISISSAAAGSATACNWVAGIIMVFVTAYLDNKVSYLVFFIMCGISALVVFFWMKETKGRPLGDSPFITEG
uniref:Putative sugar transporter 25 n=1 Tax=Phaedon cochleariae TaxID=80249 RepID=W0FQT4_PHACE|nr:putative sugar transporter 25 [Phaedon cochleariae]